MSSVPVVLARDDMELDVGIGGLFVIPRALERLHLLFVGVRLRRDWRSAAVAGVGLDGEGGTESGAEDGVTTC